MEIAENNDHERGVLRCKSKHLIPIENELIEKLCRQKRTDILELAYKKKTASLMPSFSRKDHRFNLGCVLGFETILMVLYLPTFYT